MKNKWKSAQGEMFLFGQTDIAYPKFTSSEIKANSTTIAITAPADQMVGYTGVYYYNAVFILFSFFSNILHKHYRRVTNRKCWKKSAEGKQTDSH